MNAFVMRKICSLAVLLSVVPCTALSQGIGLDIGYQKTDFPAGAEGTRSSVQLDAVVGRVSYDFSGLLGVEAQIGTGIGAATLGGVVPLEFSYGSSYGLFLRAQAPLANSLFIYGLAGGLSIRSEYTVSLPDAGLSQSSSNRRSAAAAGIGVEDRFGGAPRNYSLKAGWTRAEDDLDLVSITFGLRL